MGGAGGRVGRGRGVGCGFFLPRDKGLLQYETLVFVLAGFMVLKIVDELRRRPHRTTIKAIEFSGWDP